MKFMIVFDEADKDLIDETISCRVETLVEDDDDDNNRLADRLEALRIVPVPETAADAEGLPLVTQVIRQLHAQDMGVSQRLIDSLQWEVDRLHAALQLVTGGINDLCDQDWTPGTRAIMRELYPERERIEQRARMIRAGRGISD